jgi:CRISPR-associated endonuclease Cas1
VRCRSAGSPTAAGSPASPKAYPARTSTCAAARSPSPATAASRSPARWSRARYETSAPCYAATPGSTSRRTLARLAELVRAIPTTTLATVLLGQEGAAARDYFAVFPVMLRADLRLPGGPFHWDGRNRRPPRDAINCLLSYAYALLVKDLVVCCLAVGFDPYLGVYHRPRFGRPALALDLAEEFRPLVADSIVINMINNGEIGAADFIVRAGGVALTTDGAARSCAPMNVASTSRSGIRSSATA